MIGEWATEPGAGDGQPHVGGDIVVDPALPEADVTVTLRHREPHL